MGNFSKQQRIEFLEACAKANPDKPRFAIAVILERKPELRQTWENVLKEARESVLETPEGAKLQNEIAALLAKLRECQEHVRQELANRNLPADIESMDGIEHLARVVEMIGPFDDCRGVTQDNVYKAALAWADRQIAKGKLSNAADITSKRPAKPKGERGRKANIERTREMVKYADEYGNKEAAEHYDVTTSAISKARAKLKAKSPKT